MRTNGTVQTGRTGGTNDGGPTTATRAVVAVVAVVGIGLAVLAGAGVAGAASDGAVADGHEENVTVVFEDQPDNEYPEVSAGESFTLTAELPDGTSYDAESATFDWDWVDSVSGDVEEDGAQLTYTPTEDDEGQVLGFEVTVTDGDESDTAGIGVGVDTPTPSANVTDLDDPNGDTIESSGDGETVTLSGFNTDYPNNTIADLDFEWETGGEGAIEGLSELNENYTKDFAARYTVASADAGEEFDVTLTVTNPRDVSSTDSVTIAVDESGSPSLALGGGGGGDTSPDTAPDEAEFDVAVVDAPSNVDAGDDVEVTVEVENTGDADGTASVEVAIGDGEAESVDLDVPAGESRETNVTLTAPEDAGDYEITVDAQHDEEQHSLAVEDASSSSPSDTGDDTDSTESGLDWSSLLGAVFILALVGVVARRVID